MDLAMSFEKDYRDGRYAHCGKREFNRILQEEAEKRHAAIHEEEIAADAQKYTSLAKVYSKLIEGDGRAIYKAARDAALGGALDAPAPVAKVVPSVLADERLNISLETARAMQNPTRKNWPMAAPLKAVKAAEPGAENEDDEIDLASPIADRRFGRTISLEEARRLGGAKLRERHVDMSLRGVGDRGRSPGISARPGHTSGGESSKSATAKERSQKQYLASGSSWPSI
jgi:hypothetical protein